MFPKRPFQDYSEDGTGVPNQEGKRLKNAVRSVLGMLSLNEFVSRMEPFLRAVVREEVEKAVALVVQPSSSRTSNNQTDGRGLMLHFVNKLPGTIFTGSKIEGHDGNPIKIVLFDANTGTIVTSGALSTMKIEIVVLDGDFGSDDDQDDWTEKEFAANVIREREGRRPLLTGDGLNITLRDGVGQMGEVVFTDNSSWQRSRKFRLGAKLVQKVSTQVRIREARSEAFVVKDHRGELYKKHYPPRLVDEVWRLEKIAKDGAFHNRLASRKIHTVKDFLRLYMSNPSALRKILEISSKQWDIITEHATTCVLDDDEYYYYESVQGARLLFNCIYRLVSAALDGQNYLPLDQLTPPQKVLVESCKQQAYKNVEDFIQVDLRNFFSPQTPLTTMQALTFDGTPNYALQQLEFPITRQDQAETQVDMKNSSGSTSYAYDADRNSQIESETSKPMQALTPFFRNSFKLSDFFSSPCLEDTNLSASSSLWPTVTSTTEEVSPGQTSTWTKVN